MRLTIIRTHYTPESTAGVMLADDNFLGFTLEDTVRTGPKVPGKTAIPAGRYGLTLSMSNRFQKMLPEILTVPGFAGVRIHGGNTAADTEGCILVGRSRDGDNRIQGSMSSVLVALLAQSAGLHEVEILNAWRKT